MNPLCACRCGQEVTNSKNKYMLGHSFKNKKRPDIAEKFKGTKRTEEQRNNISIGRQKRAIEDGLIAGGAKWEHHRVWNATHPDNPIKEGDGFIIHHKDFNHDNNAPNNLQKVTKAEHNKLHHEGKIITKEHRQRISIANKGKGRRQSKESRLKISATLKGRNTQLEAKLKRENKNGIL